MPARQECLHFTCNTRGRRCQKRPAILRAAGPAGNPPGVPNCMKLSKPRTYPDSEKLSKPGAHCERCATCVVWVRHAMTGGIQVGQMRCTQDDAEESGTFALVSGANVVRTMRYAARRPSFIKSADVLDSFDCLKFDVLWNGNTTTRFQLDCCVGYPLGRTCQVRCSYRETTGIFDSPNVVATESWITDDHSGAPLERYHRSRLFVQKLQVSELPALAQESEHLNVSVWVLGSKPKWW